MVSESGEIRKAKVICAVFLAALAAAYVLIGVFILPHLKGAPESVSLTLQETSAEPSEPRDLSGAAEGEPARAAASDPSGLSLVTGAIPDMKMGAVAPSERSRDGKAPVLSISQAVEKAEGPLRALNRLYDKRYPSFRQFGVDWASFGDLRRLDQEFMRDKDPVKFVRGLAKSRNFPALVKKYAQDPAIQSFVMDAVKTLPADVKSAATHYASQYSKSDSAIAKLGSNVLSSLGLPPGLFTGGAGEPADAKQVMDSLKKSNPTLDKFMENPEAQKLLQDAENRR